MLMSPVKIVFLPMVYDWIESAAERRDRRDELIDPQDSDDLEGEEQEEDTDLP
jgi:hypothetical protein